MKKKNEDFIVRIGEKYHKIYRIENQLQELKQEVEKLEVEKERELSDLNYYCDQFPEFSAF